MKEFSGLEAMESVEEVSFARFVVMSYILGRQQFPDLVYDFFSIIRRKKHIPLTVVISSSAFQKMMTLLIEDLKPTGSSMLFKSFLSNIKEGTDFRLKFIMRIATKYPHLFWALQKFRKCYQRFVFGDEFWVDRKYLKLRHIDMSDFPIDFNDWFDSENKAAKVTARHVIADVLMSDSKEWGFNDEFHAPFDSLTVSHISKLKNVLGYKLSTKLLVESEINFSVDPIFASPFMYNDPADQRKAKAHDDTELVEFGDQNISNSSDNLEEVDEDDNEEDQEVVGEIVHDVMCDRDFVYNVETGRSRWAKIVFSEDGEIILNEFER